MCHIVLLQLEFAFPGSDGKESACNVGDPGLILGSRRSPGVGTLRRPPWGRERGKAGSLPQPEGRAGAGRAGEVSAQSGRPSGSRGTLETETGGKGRWRREKSQGSADLLPAGPCPSPVSQGAVFWAAGAVNVPQMPAESGWGQPLSLLSEQS